MKTNFKTLSIFLAVAIISLLQGCSKEDAVAPRSDSFPAADLQEKSWDGRTFYGPAVQMGQGLMRAWVKVNQQGAPTAVGINLSERALLNLPTEPSSYVLFFPFNKGRNFYTHMLVDWNPHGHEPPGVYDLPHFDFHFYTIPNWQRLLIGPFDSIQFANAPAPQFVPPLYLQTAGGVPQMGAHWVDLLAPEFNGGTFTKTFIWGSYNGKFIFWEPMITLAYLLSHPNDMVPLRQPSAFQRSGWYATDYKVSYNSNHSDIEGGRGYTIALMNLTYHRGSSGNTNAEEDAQLHY